MADAVECFQYDDASFVSDVVVVATLAVVVAYG